MSALNPDQAWTVLERWPVERALELLAVPAMRQHIEAFRRSPSKDVRRRLRRTFARLASPPGASGRPQNVPLTADRRMELEQLVAAVQSDIQRFRRKWRSEIKDAEAMQDAMTLAEKYLPLVPLRVRVRLATDLTTLRPARAAERFIQSLDEDVTVIQIRSVVQRRRRKPTVKRTKQPTP